jgi:tetratricopeptide (TPR) repeat protein
MKPEKKIRCLLFVVLAIAVLLWSTVALALTKDELISLKEQKVPDAVIISVVKSSGPLNLTKADVEKLRSIGAGEALIKFLKANGHVLVDSTPSGGGGDPDGEVDPAEDDPEAIAEEEARRKAEEDARIRAEAEKLRQADELRREQQAEINRMIAELAEAERLMQRGRYMAGAKIFLEFMSLSPNPDSDEFYRAKFGLAKALYAEGVYSGAAGPVFDVLMKGPEKPRFVEAFYMLRTITRETNYQPPQLEDLTQFYVENLDAAFQDDFNYYLGRFFYDYSKLDLAFKYLDKVRDDSPMKASALYLTGVAQIDPDVKKYRSAVQNFQNSIVATERVVDSDPNVRELAFLALARVAYEATNYDGALYYYNKVPRLSPRRPTALFESAWTYFLKNDFNRAVGSFQSLHSPYYAQWYYPDLYILEATVYLNLCKFAVAKEAVVSFQRRFLDQQPLLQNFLANTVKPEDYYETVVTIYETRTTGGDRALPMIFVQGVLNNIEFHETYKVIKNLTNEKRSFRRTRVRSVSLVRRCWSAWTTPGVRSSSRRGSGCSKSSRRWIRTSPTGA